MRTQVCFSTCSASYTQSLRSSLGSLSSLNFVTTCDAKGLGKAPAVFASGAGTCTFIATQQRFHSPTPHSCGARQTSQQKCSIASTAGPVAIAESTAIRAITGQMSSIDVCRSRHPFSRTIKRSPLLVVSERLAPLLTHSKWPRQRMRIIRACPKISRKYMYAHLVMNRASTSPVLRQFVPTDRPLLVAELEISISVQN